MLRYLKVTSSMYLCIKKVSDNLESLVDGDLGGYLEKHFRLFFQVRGVIASSRMSRLQKCVALSTPEAEYVVISE